MRPPSLITLNRWDCVGVVSLALGHFKHQTHLGKPVVSVAEIFTPTKQFLYLGPWYSLPILTLNSVLGALNRVIERGSDFKDTLRCTVVSMGIATLVPALHFEMGKLSRVPARQAR